MELAFTYEDIHLIPRYVSTLEHRAEVDTRQQFGSLVLDVPIIAAPMRDVCNGRMAVELEREGALGIIHRYQSIESQKDEYALVTYDIQDRAAQGDAACAIGVTGEWEARFTALYNIGCRTFCLDTANGANLVALSVLKVIKDRHPEVFVIIGNVGSGDAFYALDRAGADAIRVGIAGGSACETKTETGVMSPMAWVISQCKVIRKNALIIADGGIKTPSDMCKALALGADFVMMGGALAGTRESPGQIFLDGNGNKVKILRGEASYSSQQESGRDPEYVEGSERPVPYQGSVVPIIARYKHGLQSSMSYMNAHNLAEYRDNAYFVRMR